MTIYKVDFKNFDKEIERLIKESSKIRRSIEASMKVDSRTMNETFYTRKLVQSKEKKE